MQPESSILKVSSRRLLGPALLLIALGVGNAIVGETKEYQYEQIYSELVLPDARSSHLPPALSRLQAVHEIDQRHIRKEIEAADRRVFYRTVSLGGRFMMIAGFALLAYHFFVLTRTSKIRKI